MKNQPMIIQSDDEEADYLLIHDPEMIIRLFQRPVNLDEAIQRLEALAMFTEDMACNAAPIVEFNLRQIVMMLKIIKKENRLR